MEALISFKDFTFKYDLQKNPTLKKINLEIFPGEKVLIVGPSGSGKSTIGSCLNGILPHLHKGEASGDWSSDVCSRSLQLLNYLKRCRRFCKILMASLLV